MGRYSLSPAVAVALALGPVGAEESRKGGAAKPPASQLTVEALGKGFGPLVVRTPEGTVNWTAGEILAVGTAKSRRAARSAAANSAILLMQGIDAGPPGRFGDAVRGGLTVEGVLKDFPDLTVRFDPKTLTATAALRIPIHGRKGMVAMRHVILGLPLPRWEPPAGKTAAERIDAIIIDARGTGFRPCVYPRLIAPDGRAVLDGTHLRRDDPTRRNRPLYVTYAPPSKKQRPPSEQTPGLEPTRSVAKGRGAPSLPSLPRTILFGTPRKCAFIIRAVRPSEKPAGLILSGDDLRALSRYTGVMDLLELGEAGIVVDPPSR
ncbi:MAG: hypothetical protein WBF17_14070 [Phycisphaerae bacterium]